MFTNLPSKTLKQLVKLSERKEKLMAQIQDLDREMVQLQSKYGVSTLHPGRRAPVTVSRTSSTKRRRKHLRRGGAGGRILLALRAAGTRGATISQLSNKLGIRSANLHAWFNTTGKNSHRLKKIGPGKYRVA